MSHLREDYRLKSWVTSPFTSRITLQETLIPRHHLWYKTMLLLLIALRKIVFIYILYPCLESSEWKPDCHQCSTKRSYNFKSHFIRDSDCQHTTNASCFNSTQYALEWLSCMWCTAYGEMEVMGCVFSGNAPNHTLTLFFELMCFLRWRTVEVVHIYLGGVLYGILQRYDCLVQMWHLAP